MSRAKCFFENFANNNSNSSPGTRTFSFTSPSRLQVERQSWILSIYIVASIDGPVGMFPSGITACGTLTVYLKDFFVDGTEWRQAKC